MKKVTSMLRKERIDAMQAYISDVKTASMKELEDKFDIAPSTLRRDLASLIAAGTVKKVYGGVTDNTTTPSTKGNALTVYSERQLAAPNEKRQIGRAAAQLIEPEDLIFIDSGTTTAEMGGFLPTDFPFTLVTNNLQIINQAAPLANIKLVIIGMNFDRRTQSFTGIDDMNIFSRFNIGKAFMAATGISLTRGLSNSEYNEYLIKAEIFKKAHRKILLIDQSKFGRVSLLTYGALQDIDAIVTYGNVDAKYRDFLTENNVQLINAKTQQAVSPS